MAFLVVDKTLSSFISFTFWLMWSGDLDDRPSPPYLTEPFHTTYVYCMYAVHIPSSQDEVVWLSHTFLAFNYSLHTRHNRFSKKYFQWMSCFSAMNDEDMWKECDCVKNRPQFPRPPHQTDLLTIHAILQMSYSRFFNSKVARHEVWLDTELFSLVIVLKNSDNSIVKWFAIFDMPAWNHFFKKIILTKSS